MNAKFTGPLLGLALVLAMSLHLGRAGAPQYDLADGLPLPEAVAQLAARHTHGWVDNVPVAQLDAIAAERPIVATCGYVSAWAVAVLNREGYEARLVHTLTLDTWDDRNNGHTLIEAKLDGAWVLFDVDRDVWVWRDGRPLSLAGYVQAVQDGDYQLRPLSDQPVDLAATRAADARLIQVPLITEGGTQWFYSARPERVMAYASSYQPLSEADWLARFYPVQSS